ncbi:TOMM precursor leader peptide-binding protein [Actinacidiphila acidipaludis]|uniref:TOMM leader peptide-binding protein n=1 Tax=Actinacidiphila acidipaludis TaxID=2873382 RepID=A0ABS7Q514_9ACTN|nr:TOMM precursor leader peptide-binding protein [Streptomyces acidipaludis]MBY8877936.1 TOMM precursor leader peptide-binding protein [Streptomyces acidipaludis]
MTGQLSMAELCEGLDESRRRTAIALMRTLLDRGFARDVPPADDTVLDPAVSELFAPQINFVEHVMHADRRTPQELFARFRSSRVLVSGPPGDVGTAVVRGLLRNGLAEVSVDDTSWGQVFDSDLAYLAEAGAPASVAVSGTAPADLAAFDVVVRVADSRDSTGLLELTRRLGAVTGPLGGAGPRLVPVVADSGRVVLGPVSGPDDRPCWVCAQLRLSANSDPGLTAEFWRGLALGPLVAEPENGSAITRSMVGNAVAFEVFRLGSGQLQPDDERHAVIQDLTTLESRRERVLPHPACPMRHGRAEDGERPEPPVDDNDAYGRASVLVSPSMGLMSGWTDESFKQIPLKMGRVRLGPAGALTDTAREIAAFDVDTILVARTRAVRTAVACYVGRLGPVGPDGAHRTADGAAVLPPERLEIFCGLGDDPQPPPGGLRTAVSLHDGSRWQVPAAALYPLSAANARLRFEPGSAGAAADWTPDAVRERGLCSALARRGLVRALSGAAPAALVDEGRLAGDDEVAFALGSLRHFGRTARVLALPGAAPAAAVLAVVEDADGTADWAVGSALSVRGAVRAAVRDAVGLAVGRHYENAPVDPGDPLLPDFHPRVLAEADARSDWSLDAPLVPMAEALARLDADGTRALFADTTTVDLHAIRGMVTGTVLLAAQ